MSDSNANSKIALSQVKPSHNALARADFGIGFRNSTAKAGQLLQNGIPDSKGSAAILMARTALAGGKSYVKSAYHAGMGMMQGFMQQNPNSGQQLNNMKTSQSLTQGRNQQSNAPKGNASNALKGKSTNSTPKVTSTNASNALKGKSTSSTATTGTGASSGKSSGGTSGGSSKGR